MDNWVLIHKKYLVDEIRQIYQEGCPAGWTCSVMPYSGRERYLRLRKEVIESDLIKEVV